MIYQIQNLKFEYRKDQPVLNSINLSLNEGEILCALGKNGAGKTTLFGCLLGLLNGYEGSILLDGKEISSLKEKDIAKLISYVPQNNNAVFGYTVCEYVLMGCASNVSLFSHPGKTEEAAVREALALMGILDLADRNYMQLSGGERQQTAIARAIVSKPKAILFDEPTAHLDYANQLKVLRMIKGLSAKGFAVIVTSHDPNHAMLLDSKLALFDGKGNIKTGEASELITEESLQEVYGSELKIRYIKEFNRKVCIYPSL